MFPQCAEGPLAALELAMHFERNVTRRHRSRQHQQHRHRQGDPHVHVFLSFFIAFLVFQSNGTTKQEGLLSKEQRKWGRNGRVHGCQGARGRAMNIRGDTRKIVKRASRKATRTDTTDGVRWLFWEGWLNSFQFFFPVSRLLCPFDVCRRSSPFGSTESRPQKCNPAILSLSRSDPRVCIITAEAEFLPP